MRIAVLFLLALRVLTACSGGMPPVAEVDAIEAITAKKACVGVLDRWHRVFTFQWRDGGINRGVITVTYVEAGHRGQAAGRVIARPERRVEIDDSQHRVAGGEYDRAAGRFVEWSCGCNFPPYDVDHQIECPAAAAKLGARPDRG